MTNAAELDRHTALLVACLYRQEEDNRDWRLWILAQPRQGRTVNDNVPDLKHFLRHNNPPPVAAPIVVEDEDEIVVTSMPTGLETLAEEEEIVVTPLG